MKMMKWALLGGAAFAVMATSAQADELTALKAQLEALQVRVTQLEAQPATSMPSGYSLLSFRDGSQEAIVPERQADRNDPNSGFTLQALPAAEMAPAAEVSVSGELRTILLYQEDDGDNAEGNNELDVVTRGRLVVQGKVDTAVGEVGGHIRLQGGEKFDTIGGGHQGEIARMNQAYGWWKFAPNWQLIAGYWDTTAAIQAGVDWDFTLVSGDPGFSDKNVEQMRLVYTSGPFTAAIALEDTDPATTATEHVVTVGTTTGTAHHKVTRHTTVFHAHPDRGDFPDIAGYLMYNNNKLMFMVAGVYQDDQVGHSNDYGVGAGARIGLGDMFTLTAGVVYAKGYAGYNGDLSVGIDDKFWGASGGLIFNLAAATRLEAGFGYADNTSSDEKVAHAAAGIYWDPVSQVTVGLEGDWINDKVKIEGDGHDSNTTFAARFGTWLRFP